MPIKVLATACLYIMKEHWLYMKQINILTQAEIQKLFSWLSAELQPDRSLLNTAVNNEQQKGNSEGSLKTLTLSM